MFGCKRCGKCCKIEGQAWKDSVFLREQRNKDLWNLLDALSKYCKTGKECLLLGWNDDGQAVCILQVIFGYEAKPERCKDYPKLGVKCKGGILNV